MQIIHSTTIKFLYIGIYLVIQTGVLSISLVRELTPHEKVETEGNNKVNLIKEMIHPK